MIRKSRLVNALFLLGFPMFGIGSWYGLRNSISEGMVISVAPFVAIILFFLVDSVYNRPERRMLTSTWWLCLAYCGTLMASMVVALKGGIPGVQTGNVLLSCLVFVAPFTAAVIVNSLNRDDKDFDFARLVFFGLGALLLINILGYLAGIKSEGHSFEGRANFPFIRGIYTGAHVLSVFCLMLLFRIKDPTKRPVAFTMYLTFMVVGIVFMMLINSRLSFLIFLLLTLLFVTRAIKVARGLYTISLFTLPLLLSFSLLVYSVLSSPVFASVLKRVSKEDVTTFNGRSYMWLSVGDWAVNDRTGIWFGNGYKGHYPLGLLEEAAIFWEEPHPYNLHTHSTFTEVAVAQGVLGLVLIYMVLWRGFTYYRKQYLDQTLLAPMFGGFAYLLFIWQVDIFCYGVEIGHAILMVMMAPLCLKPRSIAALG
ncbi:MAG TPA: O-antigen ligase family protein [Flavobacteriales bacterium]|nr:O-antigen ligase family protein [Flavobacteriales bacterium]